MGRGCRGDDGVGRDLVDNFGAWKRISMRELRGDKGCVPSCTSNLLKKIALIIVVRQDT